MGCCCVIPLQLGWDLQEHARDAYDFFAFVTVGPLALQVGNASSRKHVLGTRFNEQNLPSGVLRKPRRKRRAPGASLRWSSVLEDARNKDARRTTNDYEVEFRVRIKVGWVL